MSAAIEEKVSSVQKKYWYAFLQHCKDTNTVQNVENFKTWDVEHNFSRIKDLRSKSDLMALGLDLHYRRFFATYNGFVVLERNKFDKEVVQQKVVKVGHGVGNNAPITTDNKAQREWMITSVESRVDSAIIRWKQLELPRAKLMKRIEAVLGEYELDLITRD